MKSLKIISFGLTVLFRSYSFGLIQVPLLFYSAKSSSLTVKKQLMFALKARFSVLSISAPFLVFHCSWGCCMISKSAYYLV